MEYNISDLLAKDLAVGIGEFKIGVPDWAFKPDAWSNALLRGLRNRASEWSGKRVWEIGVGTGINQVALGNWVPDCLRYYSDFDHRCTELAERNTVRAGIHTSSSGHPLIGRWDLLRRVDMEERAPFVDVIFGCLPQVPIPALGDNEGADDRLAHYYDPRKYPDSHLHVCGLGLNDALLHRARHILPERGEIILNLGGRPGLGRLQDMFCANGFSSEVLHQETIQQHAGTTLRTLVQQEQSGGSKFEFFSDPEHCHGISAAAAEALRQREEPVYHRIYVMIGRPI